MTKVLEKCGQGSETEPTAEMIRAGVDRLADLLEAGTGSAYVVSEVYLAMQKAKASSQLK
jgi:hypothetical protein